MGAQRNQIEGSLLSSLGNFVWSIADQLRGVYKPHQYGNVILPFTILRRLDCIMEPHRDVLRALDVKYENRVRLGAEVKKQTGLGFYNTSSYGFGNLLADPDNLRENLIDYLDHFSPNIDVFDYFEFRNEVDKLSKGGRLFLVTSLFEEVDLHPDKVPNSEMGEVYEDIIRKFAEASNETSETTTRLGMRSGSSLISSLPRKTRHCLNRAQSVRSMTPRLAPAACFRWQKSTYFRRTLTPGLCCMARNITNSRTRSVSLT
jgi:type I restriction-modification system DNA methylase subunit